MKKKALILSFSDLSRDPRVLRQVEILQNQYELTLAGIRPPTNSTNHFIQLGETDDKGRLQKLLAAGKLLLGRYDSYYEEKNVIRQALPLLEDFDGDLIIGNDLIVAPLIQKIKKNALTILDLHEYTPEEFSDIWHWRVLFGRFYHYICRQFLNRFDATITVCEPIAQRYVKEFGIAKPLVFENRAHFCSLPPSEPSSPIRVIHHGAASPSRKIELMIEAVGSLEGYSLDLMMVSISKKYDSFLRELAAPHKNIRFIPTIPYADIVPFTNSYDIGLFLLPPTNFNYENALPNKFFEFVQAKLAIGIAPSPPMANYIRRYQNGFISKDFSSESMRDCLRSLAPEAIYKMKLNAGKASHELSYESHKNKLLDLVRDLERRKHEAKSLK